MNVGVMYIENEKKLQMKYFGTIKAADVVIVTGGDQLRLTSFLGDFSRYFIR
jgi:cyanophycinase-like exopeptidase